MTRVVKGVVGGVLMLAVSSVGHAQASESRSFAPYAAETSLGVSSRPDSVTARPSDTFLGADKVKHFMMSAFIEAIGFNSLQAANVDRGASLGAATALTLGIGVARELHDGRTKGLFSLGDLTWDTLGTAAALLIFSHSQR